MLVLSRKKEESINIGENIKIKVLDVQGENVSLGIEAPRQIPVYRTEIHEAIKKENRNAVVNSQNALNNLKSARTKKK